MKIQQIIDEQMKELIGNTTTGIVQYSDGLAVTRYRTPFAVCTACGFSAKGEEARKMMFGHKKCPKANDKYIKNSVTAEKLEQSIRKLIEAVGEELIYLNNSVTQADQRLKLKEIINSLK